MVTCRDGVALNRHQLLHVRLKPFDDPGLDSFVRNWFNSEPNSFAFMTQWLAQNSAMKLAAKTPLIAALLCTLYGVGSDMPTTEVELYEERFGLLLGRWDQAKGICPLTAAIRRRYWHFLMKLAFQVHNREERRFDRASAMIIATEYYDEIFHRQPDAMLADCVHRGIILEEPYGKLSFGHLTYQEFLAARFLAKINDYTTTRMIVDLHKTPWWNKVIDFYAAQQGDISSVLALISNEGTRDINIHRIRQMLVYAPLTPKRYRQPFEE